MTHFPVLPHHKLIAFSVAKELLFAIREAHIRDAKLRDEALRSAKSACLNTAEGAGQSPEPTRLAPSPSPAPRPSKPRQPSRSPPLAATPPRPPPSKSPASPTGSSRCSPDSAGDPTALAGHGLANSSVAPDAGGCRFSRIRACRPERSRGAPHGKCLFGRELASVFRQVRGGSLGFARDDKALIDSLAVPAQCGEILSPIAYPDRDGLPPRGGRSQPVSCCEGRTAPERRKARAM